MNRNSKGQFIKGHRINLGKKRSEETKEKIRRSKKGQSVGSDNPAWKGGIRKSTDGRYLIWKPTHPFADSHHCVLRYRLVAEKCLGRYLTSKEVIHHINGDKSDDRPENLYLFESKSKHTQHHDWKITPELKSNLITPPDYQKM